MERQPPMQRKRNNLQSCGSRQLIPIDEKNEVATVKPTKK
jgi:hypothetical protein